MFYSRFLKGRKEGEGNVHLIILTRARESGKLGNEGKNGKIGRNRKVFFEKTGEKGSKSRLHNTKKALRHAKARRQPTDTLQASMKQNASTLNQLGDSAEEIHRHHSSRSKKRRKGRPVFTGIIFPSL